MCQSPHDHKNMEDLMAMPSQVKPTRSQSLWNPADIKSSPSQVEKGHGQLIGEDEVSPGVVPVDNNSMDGRDNAKEPHGGEEHGSEPAELASREPRREQGDDGEGPHGCDPTKVAHVPV
ncbi:hypothetical protein PanWU01x14_279590 [Parasponia andersonii]|uniref:Uncharacterized protein n=1 Tax=Parasponia andersonii TaxID=3476 RepID=A0A2P5B1T1_PARAD|nr:hypothetical protein PanWU01x14_279590 [Parasponia andersonii]